MKSFIQSIISRPAAVMSAAVAGLVLAMAPAPAWACTSCNFTMLDEVLNERSDTAMGRDVLAAAANQHGLALSGLSSVQATSESMLSANAAFVSAMASATGANPAAAPLSREEIIARDASLSVPMTSYVDQDIEPDHSVTVRVGEGKTYLGNGVIYEGFLMNNSIPGPTIVVEEGDVVEFIMVNEGAIPHGASLHAAYTQTSKYMGDVGPGQTKSVKFRATYPGVFMYHCAPGGHAIPMHVISGQYGMMVVKPKQAQYKLEQELGHEPDLEIFLTQHEVYASGADAIDGKAAYTMFNGKLFRYVEDPIRARPGDYVRIYFMNVGPNLISTFHIVGIVWDYAYWQGHPEAVFPGGQSVLAGPTDTWVIEFRIPPDEGAYTMLSHAVGSTSRGAIGLIVADFDEANPTKKVLADGPSYTEAELEELAATANRRISPFAIGSADVDRPVRYTDPDEEVIVRIIGNSYDPKIVEVPAGTTVTWINEDVFTYLAGEFSGVHNAVGLDGPARFASPLLAHAEQWSHTFTEPGEYNYLCTPHPYMRGRVVVTEPKTQTATADEAPAREWSTRGVAMIAGAAVLLLLAAPIVWLVRRR